MNQNTILEQNIKLNASASDWKDAVRQSGQLLIDSNYITRDYIESMIKVVEELGPYIVICPGLALAHSRPEPSVLKTGISILTLSTPINFNSENDPVDIVITLAAIDDTDHLGLLERLSTYLSEDENMNFIKSCTDPLKLAEEINNYEL